MKIHYLLTIVLVLYVTQAYTSSLSDVSGRRSEQHSSSSSDVSGTRSEQQVALHQELSARLSSSYVSLSRVPSSSYHVRRSTSDLVAIDEAQNLVVRRAPQELTDRHSQERLSRELLHSSDNDETTNRALIPSDARIVEVPVPVLVVLDDYRAPKKVEFSVGSRIALAIVGAFTLIKFGLGIAYVVENYPQQEGKTPVAEVAADAISLACLAVFYNINSDSV
jgi:hypothetical protein